MPEDAPANGGAPPADPEWGRAQRVSEMQAKLHRWAAADPGRRFDDLFNFVHDPATLQSRGTGSRAIRGRGLAGVDGRTVAWIESEIGVPAFLDGVRERLKARTWCPMPARERTIPKPGGSGKVRRLGIPRVEDRLVQAALKLVLEPIFEADCAPRGAALPDAVRDRVGLLSQQGPGSWGQPEPGGAGEGGSSPENVAGARYYQTRRPR